MSLGHADNLDLLFRHLTDDGLVCDGTNQDMTVDGSSTAVPFHITVPAGERYYIGRLIFSLMDGGTWNPVNFSGLGAPLTNGITLKVMEGTTEILDLLDNLPWKTTHQMLQAATRFLEDPYAGGILDDAVLITIDFFVLIGDSLFLEEGQRLELIVSDNLTGISAFNCRVYGQKVNT